MCIWGDMHLSDLGHPKTISDPLKLVFEVVVKAAHADTKWPQELHMLLVAEPGTSLALSLTVITALQFQFYFCKLLTMKRPICGALQALWIPNSAHLNPRKTRGKWCWAHIACKHGSFLLLNFMVSTPWSRIYIPNRRMKEVERGGKATSQHPNIPASQHPSIPLGRVIGSCFVALKSGLNWSELLHMVTPCHKSNLEMQSSGGNNNHVTKTKRQILRENCLLLQIYHKAFLKIKKVVPVITSGRGLHRWAETCGSRSYFHQHKGNCYSGKFLKYCHLLNKWPQQGGWLWALPYWHS